MKVIAALFCLMVGGVLCFAPPLYGPYPTTSTSGGGSATNVVLRGAVAGLITTNGTGDWTLTGNAATATWATNLNAPRSVSEVLVSHPTTDSVTSYWGFKYSETANKSSLTLGEAEDIGNPLAKRGELYFFDPITEVNASLSVTNGLLYSEHGLILKDGSSGELRAVINGTYVRIMKPEQHSPAEKIVYWGTPQLAAQAWLVGTTEEGITNGRFSWLFGDIGPSWNLQRTTNAFLGANYLTGEGATNVTSWMVGNNAGALRSVVSYNSDADRHIIGGTSRGLSVLGTNVVLSVGTNSITVATNQITILGDTYLGSEAYGMSGLSFWDSLEANYRDFRYDVDLECFRLAGGFAAVGNIVALSSGVFYGNGAGITNINAANISGDLVVETLTVATQYVTGSITGNGSGLTNLSPAIATNNAVATDGMALVKRGNNLKLETISGSGNYIANTNGTGTNTVTYLNTDADHTLIQSTDGGPEFLMYSVGADTLVFNHAPIMNGSGITNINAANISGDLVVETLTVATQYVTDAIIGNGSGLTNVNATNIVGNLNGSNIVGNLNITTQIVTQAIIGNGVGISNAVDLIAGDSSVTIVTNAYKRSFTLTAAAAGESALSTNMMMFPFEFPPTTPSSTATPITNATYVMAKRFDRPFRVNSFTRRVGTAVTGGFVGYGIYSFDGNTKLFDTGPLSQTTGGILTAAVTSPGVLPAGMYYIAWTGDSSATVSSFTMQSLFSDIFNGAGALTGTAANTSTAGQLPTTLGTITASTGSSPANVPCLLIK